MYRSSWQVHVQEAQETLKRRSLEVLVSSFRTELHSSLVGAPCIPAKIIVSLISHVSTH